jgi:hypothetical protein
VKKTNEAEVLRSFLQYLPAARILAMRVNSGGAMIAGRFVRFNNSPGCSDVVGVLPAGRFLALEAKRPGGRTRPDQTAFLENVTRAGGLSIVAASLDELRAALRAAGYEAP